VESIDQMWIYVAVALAAGIVLGVVFQRLLSSSAGDAHKLRAELEQARTDMERYKASVNSHFSKTSDLVSELTQDYVKVYQHLSEGAQKLSDSPEFTQVLEQAEGRVLISVEDETPEPETVIVEPPADTAEPAGADDPIYASVDSASSGDPATESIVEDLEQPAGSAQNEAEPSVTAPKETQKLDEDRKDPVIGDGDPAAEEGPSIAAAAQTIDSESQSGETDSARRA